MADLRSLGTRGLSLDRIATIARYKLGQTLYFQTQQADFWYWIVSGGARECSLTAEGRRQIVDFLLPGDLFGLCRGDVRKVTCEIIGGPTTVVCYPRSQAEALANVDPQVARWVREMAFRAIERLQARIVLLGRNRALEKICGFLLEMEARSAARLGEPFPLPMSRYDIADYLAVAVETVSRTLTALRQQGAITLLAARRVQINDHRLFRRQYGAGVPTAGAPQQAASGSSL